MTVNMAKEYELFNKISWVVGTHEYSVDTHACTWQLRPRKQEKNVCLPFHGKNQEGQSVIFLCIYFFYLFFILFISFFLNFNFNLELGIFEKWISSGSKLYRYKWTCTIFFCLKSIQSGLKTPRMLCKMNISTLIRQNMQLLGI